MKPTSEQIEIVHNHFQAEGKNDVAILAGLLGFRKNATSEVKAVVAAVALAYPDLYEAPAPEVLKEIENEVVPTERKISLLENGILKPLVVVTDKPGKLILKFDEPTDVVSVFIKGGEHKIDLYQLRKEGAVSPFEGISLQSLIMIGELAKA